MLAVEVKNALTKDRIKKTQRDFRDQVTKRGGMHFFADTYENFKSWYDQYVYDERTYKKFIADGK